MIDRCQAAKKSIRDILEAGWHLTAIEANDNYSTHDKTWLNALEQAIRLDVEDDAKMFEKAVLP